MSASHRPMPGGNSRASSRNGLSMASLSCSTHRTAARKVPSAVALDDLSEEVLPIGSSHPNAFSSERNPLDLHFFQRALEQAAHSTTEDGDSAPLLSNLKRDGFALRPRRGRNGRTAVEGASWSSVGKFSMESNDLFVDASNSIPKPLDLVDSIVTDARHGQAEGPGLQRFYTALFELHAEEVVQRTQLISLFLHQANQLGCCALTLDSPPSFHDMAGYMSWLNTLLRLYMSNIVEENIVDYYDIYARLWASPSTTPARRHERHPVSQLRISVPGMSDLSHCASSRYYTSVLAPLHMSSPSDSRKGSGVSASSPNGSPTFSTPDGLLPWDTPAKTREQRAQEATATRSAAAELADLRFSIQAFLVEHFAFSMRLSKWNDNSKRNSLPLDMIVLPVFHSPPAASNEAGGNELSPPAKRYRVDLHHSVQMILFLMDRSADDCPIPLHAFMPFPDVFWTSFISLAKYSFSLRCLATSQDVPLLQSYLLHPEDATHARSSHHARRTLIDREMEYRNIALNLHASWLQIACNVRSFLTKPKDEALPSIQLERFAKRKTMSQSSIFCSESSSTSQASSRTHIPSDNDAEVQSVRDEVVAAPAARPHAPSIESEGTPRLVNLFNTPEFTSPTVPSLAANRDDAWKDATGASTNQLGFFPQASFSLAMDDSHYAPEGIRSPVKRIAAQMGAARVRDNTTTLMDDYAELSPQGEADGDGFSNAPRRSRSPGTDFFNFEVGDSVSTDGNLDASLRYQSMRDTISRRPSVSMQESWSSQMIRSVDNAEALFRIHPPSRIRSMKRDASPAPGTLVGSNTRQRHTAKGPASTADDKINSAFWIELLMSASALEPNTAEASTAQGTDSSAVPSFSQCTSMIDVRYTQLLRMEALQRQYTALEEFRWRSGIFFGFDYTITQDRNYEDLSAYATMLAGVAMQWQSPPLRFAWAQQKEEKLFMLHREQTEQRTIYFENMCVLFHYQEMDTALQFFVHLHEEFQRHTESLLRLKTHASRVFGGSSSFRLRETTTDDARSIGRPPLYVRTSISDTPVSVLRSRPSASAMKQDLPVTDSRRYRRGLPHSPIEHGGDGDCDTSVSFASQQRLTPTSVTADQPDKVDPSPAQHLLSEKADTAVWVPRGGTAPQPPVAAVAGTTQSGQFNGTDSSAPLELLSLGSTNTLPSTKAVDDEQTAIIAKATYILPRKLASARRQTASQEAEAVSLPTRGTSAPPRSSGLLASPLTQRLMSSKDGASRPYNACRFWGFVDEVIRARQTKSFSMGLQLLHRLAQEFLQHGRQGVAPAGWTTPMSSSSVFMEHTYSNGDSYSGFWRDEQRWGLGMYHSSVGGFTYFGEWRRDAMCGDGVLLHIMSRALQNISTSCAANSVTSRHSSKHRNSTSNINSKSVSTITCVSGTNMPGNASLGSALYFFLGTEDAVSVPDPSMHKRLSTLGTTHEGGVAQVSMSLDVAQVHLLYAYFMHGELVTSCAYFSKTLS